MPWLFFGWVLCNTFGAELAGPSAIFMHQFLITKSGDRARLISHAKHHSQAKQTRSVFHLQWLSVFPSVSSRFTSRWRGPILELKTCSSRVSELLMAPVILIVTQWLVNVRHCMSVLRGQGWTWSPGLVSPLQPHSDARGQHSGWPGVQHLQALTEEKIHRKRRKDFKISFCETRQGNLNNWAQDRKRKLGC